MGSPTGSSPRARSPPSRELHAFGLPLRSRSALEASSLLGEQLPSPPPPLREGVTEEEVEATIRRLQAAAVYARDDLETGARVLGQTLANGGIVGDIEFWPERIAAVTPADVMGAARIFLRPERSVTGELLPKEPES